MKNILTINPGSTAVKYALFNEGATMIEEKKFDRKLHNTMQDDEVKWLSNLNDVGKIAIRVVHGMGALGPMLLNIETKILIKKAIQFAPIHNAVALDVINIAQDIFKDVDIIVSFDTDFHTTIPKLASTYPIPTKLANKLKVKRYGFHGIAIDSILRQVKRQKNGILPNKIICAHLGGGCSVTAVKTGKSIDTTMGLTPLEGLMMITRSGSVGPGVVEYIGDAMGWTATKVLDVLNTKSGFFGLTGSKNTIDIIERASKHQEPEKLAFDIFVNKIVQQIFAYYGTLQGCDMLIFSGGIGYGNSYLRSTVLKKLKIIGITTQNTLVVRADEARVLFENAVKF